LIFEKENNLEDDDDDMLILFLGPCKNTKTCVRFLENCGCCKNRRAHCPKTISQSVSQLVSLINQSINQSIRLTTTTNNTGTQSFNVVVVVE